MSLRPEMEEMSSRIKILLGMKEAPEGTQRPRPVELAKIKDQSIDILRRPNAELDFLLTLPIDDDDEVNSPVLAKLHNGNQSLEVLFQMALQGVLRDPNTHLQRSTTSEDYVNPSLELAQAIIAIAYELRHLRVQCEVQSLRQELGKAIETFGSASVIESLHAKMKTAMDDGGKLLNLLRAEESELARKSAEQGVEKDLEGQIDLHKTAARHWSYAFVVSIAFTFSLMLWAYTEEMWLWGLFPPFRTVAANANYSFVIAFALGKMVIIGVGIAMSALCVRLYQTNIHNMVINRHRLTSLRAFEKLLATFNDQNDPTGVNRQNLVVHACQAIMQHSETGFLAGDLSKAMPLVQLAADLAKGSKG